MVPKCTDSTVNIHDQVNSGTSIPPPGGGVSVVSGQAPPGTRRPTDVLWSPLVMSGGSGCLTPRGKEKPRFGGFTGGEVRGDSVWHVCDF